MHLKQEIVSEALNKLTSKGAESASGSIKIPVTLLAPNYHFYTYEVEFEKAVSDDGVKSVWVPKEVIKL